MHSKKALLRAFCVFLLLCIAAAQGKDRNDKKSSDNDQLIVAQISDTHLGLARAPKAADNLRWAVQEINKRHPDAVLVTGDIGERPSAWDQAKDILKGLDCKNVFIIPGNHDDKADTTDRWRQALGPNYQEFHVKWATFIGLDSQLLGNYDDFNSHSVIPLPQNGQQKAKQMLDWLGQQLNEDKSEKNAHVIFVMQHVPISRNSGFPNDPKPYWTIQDPYRSQEIELLHKAGIQDVFEGHWHAGMTFKADGFTQHVAPALSWSPFNKPLGFSIHAIKPDGSVKTDFVYLPGQ